MDWSTDQLQKRFFNEQRMIENDLNVMRKRKIPRNPSYKRFYDEQLGALSVYIILETTAALESPFLFLNKLKEMHEHEPIEHHDAYSQERVASGWRNTLKQLIKEFEEKCA